MKEVLLKTRDGFDWYVRNGELWRALSTNPLDVDGYRMGGRWECSVEHAKRFPTLYGWLFA